MVLEHLDSREEAAFMAASANDLRPGGFMIGIVPASPRHWGIEDEIAGHRRRYTRNDLASLTGAAKWQLTHVAGLTYPLSNLLLPVSNALVARQERSKLKLSKIEQTKQSGLRNVVFKTRFPRWVGVLLNEVALRPFHALQKALSGSRGALVLYFEAVPQPQGGVE